MLSIANQQKNAEFKCFRTSVRVECDIVTISVIFLHPLYVCIGLQYLATFLKLFNHRSMMIFFLKSGS